MLEELVFNTKSRFMAATCGHFPALLPGDAAGQGEATIRPSLLKQGDRLAGYLQVDRNGEESSYSVGVFAEFVRLD